MKARPLPTGLESAEASLPAGCRLLLPGEGVPDGIAPERCVGLLDGASPEETLEAALRGIGHVIPWASARREDRIRVAARLLAEPRSLLASPVETLLPNDAPSRRFHYSLASTSQKDELLERARAFLATIPRIDTLRVPALTVLDELATNALYHEPSGSRGGRSRRAPSRLSQGASAEIFAAEAGGTLLLGASDSHGALDAAATLERVLRTYALGLGDSLRHGAAGAGIGMRIVYEHSDALILGVEAGRRTVVCSELSIGRKLREAGKEPKGIHVVRIGGEKR